MAQDLVDAREYSNNLAKFVYSSYATNESREPNFIRHSICNVHKSMPLIFSWNKAGFSAGPNCPLAINQCAVHERPAAAGAQEIEARIGFIQDGASYHDAGTFVPPGGGENSLSPNWLNSTFFGYFGGSQCPEILANISLWAVYDENNKNVILNFYWHPARVTIAYGFDRERYTEQQVSQMIDSLSQVHAREATRDEVLTTGDQEWLGDNFVRETYIAFETNEETSEPIRAVFESASAVIATQPFIIREEDQVVAAFLGSVYVPSEAK